VCSTESSNWAQNLHTKIHAQKKSRYHGGVFFPGTLSTVATHNTYVVHTIELKSSFFSKTTVSASESELSAKSLRGALDGGEGKGGRLAAATLP
jgi:hypothetical protein